MSVSAIEEKGIIFRINRTFDASMDAMALYEATRGVWVLGSRREEAIYAFAVYKKKILEVYRIEQWFPAGTTEYQTRNSDEFDRSRWEFVGKVAEDEIRTKYIGKFITSDRLRGSNPGTYTWPDRINLMEFEPLQSHQSYSRNSCGLPGK